MNPDQFAPPPNNYDFIMSPGKPPKPKKGISSVTSNKFFMIILLIVGGTVTLMIVVAVLLNTFFGSKTNLADLVVLTQTQQEIIRVTAKGKQANDQVIKNAAMSTQLTMETHKKEWLKFLAKYGEEVDDKRLAAKKDTTTDARLKNATLTSTFDSAFTLIARSQVESYGAALQDAHNRATNATERAILARHYQQVELLLKQWPS